MYRLSCVAAFLCLTLAAPVFAKPNWPVGNSLRDQIGVNIHFTDPRPGEMDMLAASGVGWVRMDLWWEATEKRKGIYDFSSFDTLLSNLDRHHMRALLILDYGNNLYGASGEPPYDDEGRAAFARWAVAAVRHFQGRHVLWELWNEPNGSGFWKNPNPADYAKLALTADKAIHDAFPDETLIGPATSGVDLPFLEDCFKVGCLNYWDAVTVHPYRQGPPEDAGPEYDKLRKLIAHYAPVGKRIPIISGEWGYSVAWGGIDDDRQAKYAVREILSNEECGVPLSIWYDWHDDGTDPKNSEHNFGLVRNEYHPGRTPVYDPKPSYIAVSTLTRLLGPYRFRRKLDAGDPAVDHAIVFERGKDRRTVVWTTSATPHDIMLPLKAGKYTVTDWQGQSQCVTATKIGLSITVDDAPRYVIGQ
jgi:hypothetical protein